MSSSYNDPKPSTPAESASANGFTDTVTEPPLALEQAQPPQVAAHPMRGILLLLSALLFFACTDTTTKYLATQYDVPLVVGVRYIVHCALMLVLLGPSRGRQMVRTKRTGLAVVRGLCLVAGSLFIGLALARMPVAETTAIVFLSPIAVALLAGPMLGERSGLMGWVAAVVGFTGVLLIAHPSSGLDPLGIVFGLIAMVANASYQMLSRVLVATERTLALLFYTALVGSICFGLALPWFWHGHAPTTQQLLLFLSMGVNGGIGHYLFTAAFRHAPASLLAPVNYVQLLWAGLLGWMVFGHVPDGLTMLGMGIVAASGAMIALHSRRSSARP